jgi:GNAT superfamily N-acetyltransferase
MMIIRKAGVGDAVEIKKLHTRSVMALCQEDYTLEQLQGWVNGSTVEKYRLRLKKHRAYIAELDGKTIGYVRWNPETSEMCSIFVDPEHVRQGIGTRLMEIAYQDALSQGVTDFWLNASLTAVPFYLAMGWQTVARIVHGPLEGVRMTREIPGCKKLKGKI